ncbi:MAG: hypothetical protein E2O68_03910 [Deltaproteobacteria bacterium]|nr:MAG: hypothetical protein E2O68_03910 [Deltaproteobacteria bacterium]
MNNFRKQIILLLFLFGIVLWPRAGKSEYRVFQYLVKSRYFIPRDNRPYIVTSTFNPVTYLAYHGGESSLKIELLRSWMCLGNTAGKKYCNPPRKIQQLSPQNL